MRNNWKKYNKDPLPSKFNYPLSNRLSNQDLYLKNNYNFYKSISIYYIINISTTILLLKKINKLPSILITNLIVSRYIHIVFKKYYRYDRNIMKGNRSHEYIARIIGYGFQQNITTPSIFKGSLKDKRP